VSSTAGTAAPGSTVPEPPYPAPPGSRWEAAPETSRDWSQAEPDSRCRWRGSGRLTACGDPGTVRRQRGVSRRIHWTYCPQHSEGHWVADGVVMTWTLVPDKEAP
jgi:hypothetical protein